MKLPIYSLLLLILYHANMFTTMYMLNKYICSRSCTFHLAFMFTLMYNVFVVKGAGGKEAAMKWTDWQQFTREQKQTWLDQIKATYKKRLTAATVRR